MGAIRCGAALCLALLAAMAISAAEAGERRPPVLVVTDIRLDPDGDAEVALKADPEAGRRYGVDRRRLDPRRVLEDALELGPGRRVDRLQTGRDADQSVTIGAWIPDLADWRRDRFLLQIPGEAAVIHMEGDLIISVHSRREPGDAVTTYVNKYHLPPGGVLETYDTANGVVAFRAPGGRRPRRHDDGFGPGERRDLSGRWEIRLGRNEPLPPNIGTFLLDLSPDNMGGYRGAVIMERRGKDAQSVTLPIKNWRMMGDRVFIRAELQMREGPRTLEVIFDFDGELERGGALRGKAKVSNYLSGQPPSQTDLDPLTFYRVH